MRRRNMLLAIAFLAGVLVLGMCIYFVSQGLDRADPSTELYDAKLDWQTGRRDEALGRFAMAHWMAFESGARWSVADHFIEESYRLQRNGWLREALSNCRTGWQILGNYDTEGGIDFHCTEIEEQFERESQQAPPAVATRTPSTISSSAASCSPMPPECAFVLTPTPARPGVIAFNLTGLRNKTSVWRIDGDGRHPLLLIEDTHPNSPPAWSPDGTKLAFISSRDGRQALYVAGSDGTDVQKLTKDLFRMDGESWSPDGKKIALSASEVGENTDIWVIDLQTLQATNLTRDAAEDIHPAWSPSGEKIAFASMRSGKPQVYVMNTDGSYITPITEDPLGCSRPAWSPDGRRIAYQCISERSMIIEVANADGSDHTPLMDRDDWGGGSNPSWSSDGRTIAFDSVRGGVQEIYTMNVDGSGVAKVTDYGSLGLDSSDPAYRPSR